MDQFFENQKKGSYYTNLISPAPQSTSSGTSKRSRDKADSDILSAEFHSCKPVILTSATRRKKYLLKTN